MDFPKRLLALRKSKGMTQEDLVETLGISWITVRSSMIKGTADRIIKNVTCAAYTVISSSEYLS